MHRLDRVGPAPARPIAIGRRIEIRLKDRLQHHLGGGLHHSAARRALPFNETPLRFFVMGLLLVHAVSNPNFNVVMLWITCGLLASYHACVRRLVARPASAVLPAQADWFAPPQRALAFGAARRALSPPQSPGPGDAA